MIHQMKFKNQVIFVQDFDYQFFSKNLSYVWQVQIDNKNYLMRCASVTLIVYYKCMLWFADNFVNHNVSVWMYKMKWNVVHIVLT